MFSGALINIVGTDKGQLLAIKILVAVIHMKFYESSNSSLVIVQIKVSTMCYI